MEDRYLFKAKTCNGEWVAGFLHCKDDKWYISNKAGSPFAYEVRPDTICQCTGLKDKNGKLIWEGDIVWDSDERAFYEIIWNQEDMCWNVEDADGHKSEFEECYGSTIEVNGNRFDNPELLESEEQYDRNSYKMLSILRKTAKIDA